MSNDDLFTEMSEEELSKYIDDIAGDDEEYKKNAEKGASIGKIKKIRKALELLSKKMDKMEEDYSLYGKANEGALDEALFSVKIIWEDLFWLAQEKSETVVNSPVNENNLLMKSNDIIVEEIDGGYEITLPVLLPHKKMAKSIPHYANSYRTPIYNALIKKFPGKRPLFTKKAAIHIIHYFGTDRKLVDYDNFDYTHLLNCLASFFLRDDNPNYYTLHISGESGEKSYTKVIIVNEDTPV